MAHAIFIDGESGTTGLQIRERLQHRADLDLIGIEPAKRKDPKARAEALNSADLVVLCLPDAAAIEAVSLITNPDTRVVDASTAHRIAPGWVYGFPELDRGQRNAIANSKRVGNPGCYATGAISLLRPLIRAGLVPGDWPLVIPAISGYTGGGKTLVAEFETQPVPPGTHDDFRVYGLGLQHKHLPEIVAHTGLAHAPVFMPSVGRFAQGMLVEIPLNLGALPGSPRPAELHRALAEHYKGERFVEVVSAETIAELQQARGAGAAGYVRDLDPESLNGTNRLKLFVFGNEASGHAVLIAILDNLGKGASGAAVQNLNLMLGLEEASGLDQ